VSRQKLSLPGYVNEPSHFIFGQWWLIYLFFKLAESEKKANVNTYDNKKLTIENRHRPYIFHTILLRVGKKRHAVTTRNCIPEDSKYDESIAIDTADPTDGDDQGDTANLEV
jgi:hypothetical protein